MFGTACRLNKKRISQPTLRQCRIRSVSQRPPAAAAAHAESAVTRCHKHELQVLEFGLEVSWSLQSSFEPPLPHAPRTLSSSIRRDLPAWCRPSQARGAARVQRHGAITSLPSLLGLSGSAEPNPRTPDRVTTWQDLEEEGLLCQAEPKDGTCGSVGARRHQSGQSCIS